MENENKIELYYLLIMGTMGILILVFFVLLFVVLYQKKILSHKTVLQEKENKFQKILLNSSVEIAEQERKRIAANIHDDVGMMLNVLKLNISRINRDINNKKLVRDVLNESDRLIQDAIHNIQTISNNLMPPTLIKLGLIKGIGEMCRQVNLLGVIKVDFKCGCESLVLKKNTELQLYRLLKEIVTNILKHSGASQVTIVMNADSQLLSVCIKHNGKGISSQEAELLSQSGKGIGLKSIFNRVHLTNSTIKYIKGNEAEIIIKTRLT